MTVLIALSGKKRAGKNLTYMLAKLLLDEDETGKVIKVAFADALKQVAREEYGWDGVKDAYGRKLLQDLGVHRRETLGANYWVSKWRDKVDVLRARNPPPEVIFVTDCRFPNEADAVKSLGGAVWRVERPGLVSEDTHVSEVALDDYAHFDWRVDAPTLDGKFEQIRKGLRLLGLLE